MEQVEHKAKPLRLPWKWGVILVAGLLLLGWLLNTPPGVLGKADAVGYAVCHRIEARSFHIGDRALPLCARCSGQYLGAMVGLGFQFAFARRRTGVPARGMIAFLILFVLAYAVDGVNSYLHLAPLMEMLPNLPRLYEPNNILRLATGTGMGLAVAAALYPAFTSTVFKSTDERPALAGWRHLLAMVGLGVLVVLLVLTESPLVLYPAALVSAAGVLTLLTMVYAIIWMMVFRFENRVERFGQLVMPLVAGFATGLAQITAFDFVRYWLTHTWGGFPLG